MSKYELDDNDVQVILQQLRERGSGMARELADRLEAQVPITAPTKVGAVVRTDRGVLVRVSRDNDRVCEWWLIGEGESNADQAEQWVEGPKIGRITEVLSEGVDL